MPGRRRSLVTLLIHFSTGPISLAVIFFCAVAIASMSAWLAATTTPASANSSDLLAFTHEEVNLGEVPPGSEHTVRFPFRNHSTEPILLAAVETSCSCTTVEFSPHLVAPDGADELLLEFHAPESQQGNFQVPSVVYFEPNGSGRMLQKVIVVQARVPPRIRVTPQSIVLYEEHPKSLEIVLISQVQFEIEGVVTSDESFNIRALPSENATVARFEISLNLRHWQHGAEQAIVQFHTTLPQAPIITVPVRVISRRSRVTPVARTSTTKGATP